MHPHACVHTWVCTKYIHTQCRLVSLCLLVPAWFLFSFACLEEVCLCVCFEMCVLVRVETHAWLHACAIYTTCTTSISLAMHLCILGLVCVNKHIWVPVSLVYVCVCFFFYLNLSVSPSGNTSQGSYQTWVIRGGWVTLLHLSEGAVESITDKVVFLNVSFSPQCLPPPFLPTQQSNGIAWLCDKISIAPTQILLHLLRRLPAAHPRISIVCENKHFNKITLISF